MDGKCDNSLEYFKTRDGDDFFVSLKESVFYLAFTPILYFTLLYLLENKFLELLYRRMYYKNYESAGDPLDEQVRHEKYKIATELSKFRSKKFVEKIIVFKSNL